MSDNSTESLNKPTHGPAPLPWYFSVVKRALLADWRGAWRLMVALKAAGLLDKRCLVPFFDDSSLWVPLDWPWFWKFDKLSEYEPNTLRSFVQVIAETATRPAVFIDCGAHIGLVSHYVAHQCPTVRATWAFEPNPARFSVLSLNAARMACRVTARRVGVSDFTGRARLVIPEFDDDGAYILPDSNGAIDITRLDDTDIPRGEGVAMKIDVEGAELSVLVGAEKLLLDAAYFVVLFEAHEEVARRTGIDPMECVRFLSSMRPCRWSLSDDRDTQLELDRPFFEQVTSRTKRDVIVWTCENSSGATATMSSCGIEIV